jgi:zinc transporter ZupT
MAMLALITLATFFATLVGGLFALHLKDRLHLVLGFSAGAILGVAFFDLMPESLELVGSAYEPSHVFTVVALGFALYLVLDRLILLHSHSDEDRDHTHRGIVGAGSIAFHSFLDGMGIGLAFQLSPAIGVIVTVAVLAHNFSDGVNTVGLVLRGGGSQGLALRWLVVDALAPAVGIFLASFVTLSAVQLGLLLALFSGFFLYIGASDLIPESHHAHPVRWTTVMTVVGILTLYIIINLAGT